MRTQEAAARYIVYLLRNIRVCDSVHSRSVVPLKCGACLHSPEVTFYNIQLGNVFHDLRKIGFPMKDVLSLKKHELFDLRESGKRLSRKQSEYGAIQKCETFQGCPYLTGADMRAEALAE